jgi:hypothetical protein
MRTFSFNYSAALFTGHQGYIFFFSALSAEKKKFLCELCGSSEAGGE